MQKALRLIPPDAPRPRIQEFEVYNGATADPWRESAATPMVPRVQHGMHACEIESLDGEFAGIQLDCRRVVRDQGAEELNSTQFGAAANASGVLAANDVLLSRKTRACPLLREQGLAPPVDVHDEICDSRQAVTFAYSKIAVHSKHDMRISVGRTPSRKPRERLVRMLGPRDSAGCCRPGNM